MQKKPITDVTANNIICNNDFIQPVSNVVIPVNAGDKITAQFHRTSAGYLGPDPSDPIDPTNKGMDAKVSCPEVVCSDFMHPFDEGPIMAYLYVGRVWDPK